MPLDETLVAQAARRFGARPGSLAPLAGGHAMAVYEFARESGGAPGGRCVLRIIPPLTGDGATEMSPDEVRAIQAWIAYLAQRAGPVPRPLSSVHGHAVEVVEHAGTHYTVVASEKAKGILAETLPQSEWSDGFFRAIGAAAGRLHALAVDYAPKPELRRPEALSVDDLFGPDQAAELGIRSRKLAVLEAIGKLPKPPDAFVMIHGDFHFANFFTDPADRYAVTVFDFDDCGYGWTAMDTATLLFDILVLYDGADRDAFVDRFLTHYLRGYQSERAVDAFWLEQLPLFLKLLEISYYALLAPSWSTGESDAWVRRFMPGRRQLIMAGAPYAGIDVAALLTRLQRS